MSNMMGCATNRINALVLLNSQAMNIVKDRFETHQTIWSARNELATSVVKRWKNLIQFDVQTELAN